MVIFLALSLLWPLALTLLAGLERGRVSRRWWWTGALPAALVAVFPGTELKLPWLLVGMHFRVDSLGGAFLLLAAVVFTVAGWQLRGQPVSQRFRVCYGLTLAGTLGVLTAWNGMSFYACFSLMALAAYGILREHPGARRGARWYLALALVGELALLCAVLLLGERGGEFDNLSRQLAEHPQRGAVLALVYLAFAIKVGNIPLHLWVPAAYGGGHPLAVAIFGGIITNLGIFGWLRFLPLGQWASPAWSHWFLGVGLASTLYCALLGACQHRSRSILGYSSASQMGLATLLIGVGLARPDQWHWLQWVVVVFSFHHGLIKTGLVLATLRGWQHGWQLAVLALGALALAGLPPTSGWLAKHLLKESALLAAEPWQPWLDILLPLTSLTTGLMMIQFLRRCPRARGGQARAWIGLLLASLAVWLAGFYLLPELTRATLSGKSLAQALQPLLITALLVAGGRVLGLGLRLPEGDLLYILSRIRPPGWRSLSARTHTGAMPAPLWPWLALLERRLRRTQVAGLLLLSLLAALVLLIAHP